MKKHFTKPTVRPDFPKLEQKWQAVWKQGNLFETTNERLTNAEPWVFFDGPPGTNGVPHIGHMMQSALKDVWPRFWTMRGRKVIRRAGWDTHGLPVELTAEKELGIQSKKEIEAFGVQKYVDYCRNTVFRYKAEWEQAIHRIGRDISLDDAYATYRVPYILTNWWFLQRAWRTHIRADGQLKYSDESCEHDGYQRLLYRNYRILPYCCRCGTALANFEVSQGYKTVPDLTLFAKFELVDEPGTSFVAWTTTAWTLLSNVALAVGPEIEYAIIQLLEDGTCGKSGERLIVAEARLEALKAYLPKYEVIRKSIGSEFAGIRYRPLWDWQQTDKDHFVIADNYVTTEDGSGIVHLASYGEDDYRLIRGNGLSMVQNVDENGFVVASIPVYGGRFFKEKTSKGETLLDLDILKDLHGRGLLFAKEKIEHEYPFCYRCDTPLMYFARAGWFLRMTALKDRLQEGNREINWYPEHIREGRFGNWLENVIDWNFTRERFWGSPLPVWTNRAVGDAEQSYCIGSYEELKALAVDPIPEDFDLHKPAIDNIRIKHPKTGEILYREKFVLDSWFDAGMMPWGQWGYPNADGSKERIDGADRQYPCDFICEAIDQTRGWFYTLLACSVIHRTVEEAQGTPTEKLPPHSSYKNVICTELILDDKGQKMSKSKGNVIAPALLFDKWGADPVRWQFYSSNPWNVKRFGESTIEEGLQQVLLPLWNAYVFFSTYAEADHWQPGDVSFEPTPLDRWILSRLNWLVTTITTSLEEFDVTHAADAVAKFLDELNNWYIRRNRRRFWKSENDHDKDTAFVTLRRVLSTVSRLLAPFLPHEAEEVFCGVMLTTPESDITESVHLSSWPTVADTGERLLELENQQEQIRAIVTIARNLRQDSNLRVRQPLSELQVFHTVGNADELNRIEQQFGIVAEELNVKHVTFVSDASAIVTFSAKPNLKTLGPKLGSRLKSFGESVQKLDSMTVQSVWSGGSLQVEGETLAATDLLIACTAKSGWVAKAEGEWVVGIDIRLNDTLVAEGLMRELVNRVQATRKELDFHVSDHIHAIIKADENILSGFRQPENAEYLRRETLCDRVIWLAQNETVDSASNMKFDEISSGITVGWSIERIEKEHSHVR